MKLKQKRKIRYDQWKSVSTIIDCDSNLYESIHPVIRFIHDSNINLQIGSLVELLKIIKKLIKIYLLY